MNFAKFILLLFLHFAAFLILCNGFSIFDR